jgi:hypothetical protein
MILIAVENKNSAPPRFKNIDRTSWLLFLLLLYESHAKNADKPDIKINSGAAYPPKGITKYLVKSSYFESGVINACHKWA